MKPPFEVNLCEPHWHRECLGLMLGIAALSLTYAATLQAVPKSTADTRNRSHARDPPPWPPQASTFFPALFPSSASSVSWSSDPPGYASSAQIIE